MMSGYGYGIMMKAAADALLARIKTDPLNSVNNMAIVNALHDATHHYDSSFDTFWEEVYQYALTQHIKSMERELAEQISMSAWPDGMRVRVPGTFVAKMYLDEDAEVEWMAGTVFGHLEDHDQPTVAVQIDKYREEPFLVPVPTKSLEEESAS